MSICDNCPRRITCSPEQCEACDAVARTLIWAREGCTDPPSELGNKLMGVALALDSNSEFLQELRKHRGIDQVGVITTLKMAIDTGYYLGKFGFTSIDELKEKYPHVSED